MLLPAALIVTGYLCGSVASAIVVCRLSGLPDPRSGGSGNPGATNVLRLGGKRAALLTLIGDVLKGVLPVLAARALVSDPAVIAATALAAFLGHLYPLFFRFKGGKGVATTFGVVVALAWPVALAMAATWLLIAALTRYSSLAALCAGALAPLYALFLTHELAHVTALGVMGALLIWRHRANIRRLLAGSESRIGSKG